MGKPLSRKEPQPQPKSPGRADLTEYPHKMELGRIIEGDVLAGLRRLPDGCVQCVVTSPPYWGLRDYSAGAEGESMAGQWGQEPTIEAHIARMVECFREVRRVLRDDGTLWLNYGDCYAHRGASGGSSPDCARKSREMNKIGQEKMGYRVPSGLKPKDLVMMPARVALALQADGWWLRSDIIWAKPNPMPESVTDRPTSAHEHVFLFSKAQRYFYDADAVREGKAPATVGDGRNNANGHRGDRTFPGQPDNGGTNLGGAEGGRNLRNVWNIATQPYAGAHFATFPEKLVEPCIRAGTSEKGACPECGAGWRRVVEKEKKPRGDAFGVKNVGEHDHGQAGSEYQEIVKATTTGWRPGCSCEAAEPRPCIVLDPFAGSGTVGIVAYQLGREFVGIDLAGGDADLGGHTAHDRITAAREGGRQMAEHMGHRAAGQGELLDGIEIGG